MSATLPVPIEFSLPAGWRSVPPDAVGAGGAAFVALHPPSANGFTANITISGEVHPAEVPLGEIADTSLAALRAGAREVRVGERSEVGTAANPALTQAVRMLVDLDGRRQDIAQLQVYVGMLDVHDPRRRAVLHVVLSATPDQLGQVAGDFQRFVSTIRPEERS